VDDGNGIVAWLALGVAALSLAWQLYGAWQRSRTKIRVVVRHTAAPESLEGPALLSIPSLGLDFRPGVWLPDEDERLAYVLVVVVINDGDTTEYVHDIRVIDPSRRLGAGADDGTGPRELLPRNRLTWPFRPDRLFFDADKGFTVSVALGSHREIETTMQFLADELLAEIDAHNESIQCDRP
jgi:hypothetical protein